MYTEVHPPVTLTHNLGRDAIAYNGQRVTFTCTVNIVVDRDIVITWRSEDYIGHGSNVLQVTSESPVANKSTTVVMLVNSTRSSDGLLTVVTELQLVASASYPKSHLSCRANGVRARTVTFFTSLLPGNAH